MDWPMAYAGQARAAPGNVFFLHMILFDAEAGLAMTLAAPRRHGDRPRAPVPGAPRPDPAVGATVGYGS